MKGRRKGIHFHKGEYAMIYLFLAGLCEVLWPLGFKLSQSGAYRDWWIVFSVMCMIFSVLLFYAAQKSVPVYAAYPIWTGIGSTGIFLVGVAYFHDTTTWLSWLGLCLVVGGIALLEQGA